MTIKIGKYEFNSEQQALDKIEALGTEIEGVYTPDMVDSIVKLGFLVITPATYDADGNEITPPVYSDKYSVDVLWVDRIQNPYGWGTYQINVQGEGAHSFFGVPYQENKI
jgi:hypothetical protein